VLASCRERRTQDDLVAFMESVPAAYPGKQVHVIWDNLNTHRAQAVWQAFNARHGRRFHFHFTPLHASWVNQIELWFGLYTRRVLRHASHTSTSHLRAHRAVNPRTESDGTPLQMDFPGLSAANRRIVIGGPTCLPYPPNITLPNCSASCASCWAMWAATNYLRRRPCCLTPSSHDQIVTQAYGRHLLIKRLDEQDPTVVARLTELGRNHYGAAFRSHSGRWETLPGPVPLDEMAQVVVTLLQPYLQPDNY
jgi:transposase